jgi:hypothetical protein
MIFWRFYTTFLIIFAFFSCYIYFMTIEQTIEIPANRQITLEVPSQIPTGKARIELKVIPLIKERDKSGKISLTKQSIEEMLRNSPHTQALTGILHTDMTIEEIREERLTKYLK